MPSRRQKTPQRGPVAHFPEYVRRIAEDRPFSCQTADDIRMIFQIRHIGQGIVMQALGQMRQGCRAVGRVHRAGYGSAGKQFAEVPVSEKINGNGLVTSPDSGLGQGPGGNTGQQKLHDETISLATAYTASASKIWSLLSNMRAMQARWTFIFSPPIPRAP